MSIVQILEVLKGIVRSSEIKMFIFVFNRILSIPLMETTIAVRDKDLGPVPEDWIESL